MISDIPRQKLCEIVAKYGRSVGEEPRRCEGLLRDLCGSFRREISALVNAAKSKTPEALINASDGVPQEVLVARLAKRLEDDLGVEGELARWAVAGWGMALGRFTVDLASRNTTEEEAQKDDQERSRLAQDQEAKRREEEFNKRLDDERKRLEQQAKQNIEERLRLQEEQRKLQDEKNKRTSPTPVLEDDARKRKQKLIGAMAVVGILALGGGAVTWNKWQEAERARLEAIRQAEIARRQAEEQRRLSDLRLQQEQQRQAAMRQQELARQQRERAAREQQQREFAFQQGQNRQPNPWDPQQARQAELDRQRQAQFDQQRRFQEEQQRRQQEAQQRSAQDVFQKAIEEGIRSLGRPRR